jgi:hypothetical protein
MTGFPTNIRPRWGHFIRSTCRFHTEQLASPTFKLHPPDNVRHLLHLFEGHFTLGFGDGRNKPDTQIELLTGAADEADQFLRGHQDTSRESLERLDRVAALIEGFESPYGLELLATVHWAATHEGAAKPDLESVRRVIDEWSPRKRKLMKAAHVQLAWNQTNRHGWLPKTQEADNPPG